MRRAVHRREENQDWHRAQLLEGRLRLGVRGSRPDATAAGRSRNAGGREAVSPRSNSAVCRTLAQRTACACLRDYTGVCSMERAGGMKQAIGKFLQYLQSVKNSSPHTILNYGKDLGQFIAYLSPPGTQPPGVSGVTHLIIPEFVGHLPEQRLQKSSIARKLAALRSFFKYCVREGMIKELPPRLGPTPKCPTRIPSVLSAEEMNGFLNQLAGLGAPSAGSIPAKR